MIDPDPSRCPFCKSKKIQRIYQPVALIYPGRPIWTYSDTKKYKTMTQDGKTFKVDPSKHGDLGAWHTDAQVAPKKKKGRK